MEYDLKIYITFNYEIFKKLEGNRDLRVVEKIKKSIKEVGYILSPICVNENMEVIDGQNRLQALKELGLPVYYYICKGIGIKEAIQLNLGRQNWRPIDYARAYALRGNENYKRLLDLMKLTTFISLGEMACLCRGIIAGSGIGSTIITNGSFECDQKRMLEVSCRIEELEELKEPIKCIEGYERTIITGISWLMDVEGIKKDRLKDVIAKKYPLLHPVMTPRRFLEDISDIYNKSLRKEDRLYFDAIYREQLDKS